MHCAITMSHMQGPGNTPFDALYVDYSQFLEGLGCQLHYVPNYAEDVGRLLNRMPIEGVILSGGNDLSAEFTGAAARDIRNPSPVRDETENRLLSAAIARNIPVLGICRGMQFINVFFGGSLTQDLETELPGASQHIRAEHVISIEDKAALRWLGSDTFVVNSFHHQGLQPHQVSSDLEVFALTKTDRVVEGLYHSEKPIAGIQWHPERPGNDRHENLEIISAFLERRGFWEVKNR